MAPKVVTDCLLDKRPFYDMCNKAQGITHMTAARQVHDWGPLGRGRTHLPFSPPNSFFTSRECGASLCLPRLGQTPLPHSPSQPPSPQGVIK